MRPNHGGGGQKPVAKQPGTRLIADMVAVMRMAKFVVKGLVVMGSLARVCAQTLLCMIIRK